MMDEMVKYSSRHWLFVRRLVPGTIAGAAPLWEWSSMGRFQGLPAAWTIGKWRMLVVRFLWKFVCWFSVELLYSMTFYIPYALCSCTRKVSTAWHCTEYLLGRRYWDNLLSLALFDQLMGIHYMICVDWNLDCTLYLAIGSTYCAHVGTWLWAKS